ncbi:MAG: P-loop NTPase fold protein, partial [Pseudomonadota bacterium]
MNDKVDFTQTAARKGDDGGSDFEPFISPLTEVAGQPVDLSHLLDLHFVPPNESAPVPILSSYMKAILTATADQVAIKSSGKQMEPIRLGDAFRQMVGSRGERPFDLFAPFYEQLNGPEADKKIDSEHQHGTDPVDSEKYRGAVLDGDITSVLAIASIDASMLRPTNRGRIGLRHFTLAILETLEGREMLWWSGFAEGTPAPQISAIASGLREALQRQSYFGDDGQAFEARLTAAGGQFPEPSIPQPLQVSDDRYVPDKPVLTLAGDQLGFADEVKALARIVALKKPGPPLAVGLFGDWGSGKSSFMNMLEDSIEQTCADARKTDAAGGVFVKEVVHIKFNAWVYNDADLWSSLAAETFRQLRLGGSKQRGSAALTSVMDDLTKFVASSDNVAAKAEADLIDKRGERDRLRDEIDQAEEEAFQSRLELLANAASATIDDYKTKDE